MNLAGVLRVVSMRRLFFIVLIVIAVLLRAGNLGGFHPMDPDEKSWLMVGTSLISEGVPSSWTIFPHPYEAEYRMCNSVVTPFLGHPPLFGLLIGGWATLVGETDWCSTDWSLVRVPMILISVLTIIVTFLFVRRIFGGTMAIFVLLAFVFFPSHVVASRIIAAEHLIGLFVVLGLYLFAVFETTESRRIRRLMGTAMVLLCAVSLLIKLSAVVIPATLCFLSLYRRRWWLGAVLVIATIVSAFLFLAYGWYYDWGVLSDILVAHHTRPQSFAHFWTLFTFLDIGHYSMFDPSMIVGLLGLIVLLVTMGGRGAGLYLFSPVLVFSALFMYVAPTAYYGWYKYGMYPIVAIGLGYVFTKLSRGRLGYLIFFLPLLSMMLEHSAILSNQDDRRIAMLMFYGLAIWPLLFGGRLMQSRPVFLSFLSFLFVFEVLWVSRVLDYDLIVGFFGL